MGSYTHYHGQIANYVNNGSFEQMIDCNWGTGGGIYKAKYWRGVDSLFAPALASTCPGFNNVPLYFTYQWPKTGNNHALATWFCPPPWCTLDNNRSYFRNRLKKNLTKGTTYCVKFYVNICNNSSYAGNVYEAYFGDDQLDTITKGGVPLTYLNPQIQNPPQNYISDTLGWVAVSGTFVANGTEKHLVLGNFKSDANTGKILINTTYTPSIFTDVCIDDVSCIPLDLPAFAGNDTTCIPGTTIYLGRQRDVGIDEACKWYKLPIAITPTTPAIDTAAGIWVSPTQTSTYVVRQEICGNVKWDTVVVYKDAVGLGEWILQNDEVKLYPVPAQYYLQLSVENEEHAKEIKSLFLYDHLGKFIRQEEPVFKNKQALLHTDDLPEGLYFLEIKSNSGQSLHQRFLVNR